MSYGIEISTTSSTKNIADSSPCRVVELIQVRNVTGSQVVPNYDSSKGFIFIDNLHPVYQFIHNITFNNSTKVFTWGPNLYSSANNNDSVDYYFIMKED